MSKEFFTTVRILDVKLTNIAGVSVDLTRLFLSINIYESIFEHFLTGKIVIADTLDLITNFPIVGNENLEILVSTDEQDTPYTLNFKIYKLDRDLSVTSGASSRRLYIMYFCSQEAIKSNINKISKKFIGKPDTIVTDILDNVLESSKPLLSEPCSTDANIYANYWTASRVIDFCCKVAKTSTYLDYLFFETLVDFNFKPLSLLLANTEYKEVYYDDSIKSFTDIFKAKVIKIDKYFDVIQNAKLGLFGNTLFKTSGTDYSLSKTETTLTEAQEKITSLGRNSIYDGNLDNSSNLHILYPYDDEVSPIRNISLKLFNNYNIIAKFNGDLTRYCGQLVNFTFPVYDNESDINDSFNGKYLITEINHYIGRNKEFEQTIRLTKNAIFNKSELPTISNMRNI